MLPRPRQVVALIAAVFAAVLLVPSAPAAAATADRFGFAYVDNPAVPTWTALPAPYQYGTWSSALTATGGKVATGRFLVRFPNVATGPKGNVHVTAVAKDGRFCETVRWYASGADQIVDVQCFKAGGTPADTPFTVLWTVSSGAISPVPGTYASVQVMSNTLIQSYNSTAGAVSITPIGVGIYSVFFGGVGETSGLLSGNVQVTAAQPNAGPRRCKIMREFTSGPDVIVYVACHDPVSGAPISSDFTASFHRQRSVYGSFAPPKYFGYLSIPYTGPTNFNYPLGVGANGASSLGTGVYVVKFPSLHEKATTTQVTAIGDGPGYCTIHSLWQQLASDAAVPVACFSNAGVPQANPFSITFSSSA
ncbi:hypothetical protein [Dactylosporangium sp. NPDC051541]|uniref:hypothetical protein n=1 Tax=Dactylosporangium sp. NPDC051541 TaxID=3363977 RepID=UPI0037B7447B